MLKIDIKEFLILFENFLFMSSFLSFFCLIGVKYKIFQLKKNIRDIQENIVILEKQKKTLDLEIVYLSSPNRLKRIYTEVQKMKIEEFNNRELVTVKQIKDLKNLIPYYYDKADKNGFMALK